jgi:hypothetical protein
MDHADRLGLRFGLDGAIERHAVLVFDHPLGHGVRERGAVGELFRVGQSFAERLTVGHDPVH